MLSFILFLLLLTVTILVILVLRKNQQKHAKETVDRTAPLPALGDDLVPDFAPPASTNPAPTPLTPMPDVVIPVVPMPDAANPAESDPLKAMDNWQLQVKSLRASQQYDDALEICRSQFPKSQAIQQAAIILRQQIKISQEQNASIEL